MRWQRDSGQVLSILFLVILAAVFVGATGAHEGRQAPGPTPRSGSRLAPIGGAFTYQGQLERGGAPLDDVCDFQFGLWDAASGGSQLHSPQALNDVTVSDGLFTVTLFGEGNGLNPFTGEAAWLEITVQCSDDGTPLNLGRQALTAAPYAIYGLNAPWSGVSGVPPSLQDGDDDTTYSAGSGLVLNGTQLGVDTNAVQLRVDGSCPAGQYVRAINGDGSVVCGTDAPLNRPLAPFTNTLTTVDSAGDVGRHSSLTVGTDGLGLITYLDNSNGDLKVAHCDDIACTGASTHTLDSAGDVGEYSSVAIGADGLALIAYFDQTNDDLKVAHCDDLACSSATITVLDGTDNVGWDPSVTIGADGLGLISYRAITGFALKVAHCDDVTCSGASTYTVDGTGNVGSSSSVAIGADGLGLISYYDGTNNDLKVAHCDDTACSTAAITTLDSTGDVGGFTAMAIGADGLGLISYHDSTNRDLKVAHCDDAACSSATITTLDSAGLVGLGSSAAIGADGLGLISYRDTSNSVLKVAHCVDVACSGASTYTVDGIGAVGDTSLAVGSDGLPLISYRDFSNDDLVVVRCGSAYCVPHFRRR